MPKVVFIQGVQVIAETGIFNSPKISGFRGLARSMTKGVHRLKGDQVTLISMNRAE